jgi:hypothetical protein
MSCVLDLQVSFGLDTDETAPSTFGITVEQPQLDWE